MSDLILHAGMSKGETQKRFSELMNFLTREVHKQLPEGISCALVTFTRDSGQYCGYASSETNRMMVVAALRAAADRLEKKKFHQGNSQIILPN